MTKVANILLFGLLVLLLVNGIRLTFFSRNACNLVRENQMPTREQSVMEFHKRYGDTYGPRTDPE